MKKKQEQFVGPFNYDPVTCVPYNAVCQNVSEQLDDCCALVFFPDGILGVVIPKHMAASIQAHAVRYAARMLEQLSMEEIP